MPDPHPSKSALRRLAAQDPTKLVEEIERLRAQLAEAERKQDRFEGFMRRAHEQTRCPVCGCACPEDADANECGCDGPVCSIEAPETLAQAFERITLELAAEPAEPTHGVAELTDAIHKLTDGEMSWLEVLGRGVDFDQPDFAIEQHVLRPDGSESRVRFEGKDLQDCLRQALAAQDAEKPE